MKLRNQRNIAEKQQKVCLIAMTETTVNRSGSKILNKEKNTHYSASFKTFAACSNWNKSPCGLVKVTGLE